MTSITAVGLTIMTLNRTIRAVQAAITQSDQIMLIGYFTQKRS